MNNTIRKMMALGVSAVLGLSVAGCSAAATTDAADPSASTAQAEASAAESASADENGSKGQGSAGRKDSSEQNVSAEAGLDLSGIAAPDKTDFKTKDLEASWDANSPRITLSGASAAVDGTGATADGSVVTITQAGSYVVSGTLDDGRIIVEAGDQDDVQIVLNGASITSSDGPGIHVKTADKVILTIAEGTENSVTDGAEYADTSDSAPNAAVYSEQDLSLNGTGSLTVTGNSNNGIGTKDDLKIASGTITVEAANNALKGKDSVSILDGTFTLTSGGDAIQSDKDDDENKGWIVVDGGDFTIAATNDALQAETGMTINGGTFNVSTNGGSENAEEKTQSGDRFGGMFGGEMPDWGSREDFQGGGRGHGRGIEPGTDSAAPSADAQTDAALSVQPADEAAAASEIPEQVSDGAEASPAQDENAEPAASDDQSRRRRPQQGTDSDPSAESSASPSSEGSGSTADSSSGTSTSDSHKGLKAGGILKVTAGDFNLNCADDAVHSDGSVYLEGGTFTISSGDDGVHAEGELRVNTNVRIDESFEGLEGEKVYITGGEISIQSSDDAINAAAGLSADSARGFGAQDACTIEISGGTINAVGGGDGIDSNGSLTISGGDVTILIRSSADNCAIDAESSFVVTGGTVIYGGTGTGAGPGNGSTQSYVFAQGSFTAGTEVSVRKDGSTIASFTPSIDCSSLSFSAPGMTSGDTYEVYQGETLVTTATAGQGSSGMAGGGGFQGGRPGRPGNGTEPADGTQPEGMPDDVQFGEGETPPDLPDDAQFDKGDGTRPNMPGDFQPSENDSRPARPDRNGFGKGSQSTDGRGDTSGQDAAATEDAQQAAA